MRRLHTLLLLLVLIIAVRSSLAQASDCYPNCTVTFDAIARERVPVVTTVAAMGTKCDEELARLLNGYRNEDAPQYALLRNQYCSALAGWQQVSACEHGGPPPCCTAPPATMPWRQVGPERAKAVLFAEWHRVQANRKAEAERALNVCLRGLKAEGLADFNSTYGQVLGCLQEMQQDPAYSQAHQAALDGYAGQMNDLHRRMQALAGGAPDPNNIANVGKALENLQVNICGQSRTRSLSYPKDKGMHNGSRGASGSRAEVQQPQVETDALTNESPNQAQEQQRVAIVAQRQQQADAYLRDATKNSDNSIRQAKDLSLARLNALGSGNIEQARQIEQLQNQQLQQSTNDVLSTLNSYISRNQTMRTDESAAYAEDQDKVKRGWLYKSMVQYSEWFLDSTLFMQPATSAISYRTGQPDLKTAHGNSYALAELQAALKDEDYDNFYATLMSESMATQKLKINSYVYRYSPSFDSFYYLEDALQEKYSSTSGEGKIPNPNDIDKYLAKPVKMAQQGDILSAFGLFCFYEKSNTDFTSSRKDIKDETDKYFALYLQNTLRKDMSKQFGPLTQWAYLAQAADCQDSNPAKALAYIGKADSLCVNQTYSVSFPAKNPGNLGNDFARFYSQEFYYYMRFITSNIKLSIYHNLYKSQGGTSKYKTKYFNLAVTEYFKIGDELLVMFSDPKLKRPFTRDYQWSEHHK